MPEIFCLFFVPLPKEVLNKVIHLARTRQAAEVAQVHGLLAYVAFRKNESVIDQQGGSSLARLNRGGSVDQGCLLYTWTDKSAASVISGAS
ncbi:MAG: hypothetical protein ACR2NP_14475 [Pirellulaceae bacterium]